MASVFASQVTHLAQEMYENRVSISRKVPKKAIFDFKNITLVVIFQGELIYISADFPAS